MLHGIFKYAISVFIRGNKLWAMGLFVISFTIHLSCKGLFNLVSFDNSEIVSYFLGTCLADTH